MSGNESSNQEGIRCQKHGASEGTAWYPGICPACEIERLRAALLDLYNGTAEYVYLNNLGDPHNTTPMRRAAEVLGVKYPRSLRPADETKD